MSADRLLGCRGDGDGDWEVWMSADDSEGGGGIFNEEEAKKMKSIECDSLLQIIQSLTL